MRYARSCARYAARNLPLWFALCLVATMPGSYTVAVTPPKPTDSETIVPLPGQGPKLRVRVEAHEGETKTPIAAARVRVFHNDANGAFLVTTGKTAEDGLVELDGLPAGETWVLADAPGRARASQWIIWGADARTIALGLGKESSIDVDLTDETGNPVVSDVIVAGDDPIPVGVRTQPDGSAHIGGLSGERFSVTARAPGFDDVVRTQVRPGERLRLMMQKLAALRIVVLDPQGNPAPGATVQVASNTLWPPRVATTEADGAVRVGGLSPGTYALRASKGDLVSPLEVGLPVAKSQEQSVQLRLALGGVLHVRVVDDEDQPVAGASVTGVEQGLSPFPMEATTGKDGRARLGPASFAGSTVTAHAPDFVTSGPVAVPDGAAPNAEVQIKLERGGVLEGRVTDARGSPVAGATLTLVGTDFRGLPIEDSPGRRSFRAAHAATLLAPPAAFIPAGELGVMPGPVPPIPARGQGSVVVPNTPFLGTKAEPAWTTRADGTYRIEGAPPGRLIVLVRHPEFLDGESDTVALLPKGTARADVVLSRGGSLEGRVLDDRGYPVPRTQVLLYAKEGNLERSQHTGSDGSFAFASVPGEVVLSVVRDSDPTTSVARLTTEVPERGKRDVVLTVPKEREPVAVHVEDERGRPVDNVQLTLLSLDPKEPLRTTLFTDRRGDAIGRNARGLAMRIEARAPSFGVRSVEVQPGVAEVKIVLVQAEDLEGEIRSRRGDRVANADVAVQYEGGVARTTTGPDGVWRISGVVAGHATVTVRAAGFATQLQRIIVPEQRGRRAFEVPRIEVQEEGVIEGVVVDERGDALAGARVSTDVGQVYVGSALPPGVVQTDARGRFKLVGLPEGNTVLDVYVPDHGRAKSDVVHVHAGQTSRDVRILVKKGEVDGGRSVAATVAVTLGETAEPREVVIAAVAEGSSAERAGLQRHDVILAIDDRAARTMAEARKLLNGPRVDDVVIRLRRGERTLTLRVGRDPGRR
jgi:hypothetical protein